MNPNVPHDLEAEQALLGDILNLPARWPEIESFVTATDFYKPAHAVVFMALEALHASGHQVTVETVRDWLTEQDQLKRIGGSAFLFEVGNAGSGGFKRHLETVARLAALRRIQGLAASIGDAVADREDPMVIVERAARDFATVRLPVAELPGELWTLEDFIAHGQSETMRTDWVLPGLLRQTWRCLVIAPEGGGKALAVDTPIATPYGWTTMGDIQPGDLVFGADGQPVEVLAATDVMDNRPCYEIVFKDGERVVADADHLWLTIDYYGRQENRWDPEIRTTAELALTVRARDGFVANHLIEAPRPLDLPDRDLPLDPYTLGAWLGDGTSRRGEITCIDEEIIDEIRSAGWQCDQHGFQWRIHKQHEWDAKMRSVRSLMNEGLSERAAHKSIGVPKDSLRSWEKPRTQITTQVGLAATLRQMGLIRNKHIPREYMRASIAQRERLLAGLLDTDGSATSSGGVELTLCDPTLAADAVELVRSLGFRPSCEWSDATLNRRVVGRRCRIRFTPDRPVFVLGRKQKLLKGSCHYRSISRYIESVEPVESVPVRCIQVDSDDGMFLAGESLVPTHNSVLCRQLAIAASQGVHPFLHDSITPRRTLLVDLENPPEAIVATAEPIYERRSSQGLWRDGECWIWHEPGGINLRTPRHRAEFESVMATVAPDLVCIGPLYKAYNVTARESDELATGEVQAFLDDIRTRHRCALVLEHHAPKSVGGHRDFVPYGSSLWMRWPEFGFKLMPIFEDGADGKDLEVKRFRGDRVESEWPDRLRRGAKGALWPWIGEYEGDHF